MVIKCNCFVYHDFFFLINHVTWNFFGSCFGPPKVQILVPFQYDMPRLSPLISENVLLIWYGSIEGFDRAGGQYGLQYKFFFNGVVYFEGLNVPWNKLASHANPHVLIYWCFFRPISVNPQKSGSKHVKIFLQSLQPDVVWKTKDVAPKIMFRIFLR